VPKRDLHAEYASTHAELVEIREELRNAGDPPDAEWPFVQLYQWAIYELMDATATGELMVLFAIAAHADPYGYCFPGIQRLAALTHFGPASVRRYIAALVQRGFIAYYEQHNLMRGQSEPNFVVSARVLHIRPELREEAGRKFAIARKIANMSQEAVVHYLQPDPNLIQNQIQNQIPNQTQNQPTTPQRGGDGLAHPASAHEASPTPSDHTPNGEKPENTPSATKSPSAKRSSVFRTPNGRPARTGPAAQPPTPSPGSAAPPPGEDGPPLPASFDPQQPLSDNEQELDACTIKGLPGFSTLSIANARTWVTQYGSDTVMKHAMQISLDPNARNPVGLLVDRLRKHHAKRQSSETDDPGGKYAEWYE